MRDFVEEDHPAVLVAPFTAARSGHVHDLVIAEAALAGDGAGAEAGVDGEDAALRARRIFESAEGEEEEGAERDPSGVQRPPAARSAKHGCYDTDRDPR